MTKHTIHEQLSAAQQGYHPHGPHPHSDHSPSPASHPHLAGRNDYHHPY